MNNSEWTVEQTVELFDSAARCALVGQSLSSAFRAMAQKTGRSVNSVRNYYYAQAKTFSLVPAAARELGIKKSSPRREKFTPFTEGEVRELIGTVLAAKGRGVSVRAAISAMADGDPKKALRLQNKYRSCIKSHRDLVERVIADLTAAGVQCFNPYGTDNFSRLTEYIASLDSARVGKFLSLIEKLT